MPTLDLEYQRSWRQRNPEGYRAYQREWARNKRRQDRETILDLLGGACAACGIDDPIVLDVDHVQGGGNEHRSGLGHRNYQEDILRRVRSGDASFQLLCGNCHRRKTRTEGRLGRPRIDQERPETCP